MWGSPGHAVAVLALLSMLAAPGAAAAGEVAAEALLAEPAAYLLVDIRQSGETPHEVPVEGLAQERLTFPTGGSGPMHEAGLATFYAGLKDLARRYPGRRLVLACSIAGRSREALRLAPGYGLQGRLWHLAEGLDGNDRGIGLLDAARLR